MALDADAAWPSAGPGAATVGLFEGLVPITIGVTGHRALGALETVVATTAAAECRRLKALYPATPFAVLSSLAEGADRIVARVAMRELGAKLIAVLPLPAEAYERDFATGASRAEFRALLAEAAGQIETSQPAEASLWTENGEPRNRQYARAGGFIVEHALILFAVWDGQASRGTGGTADVVSWFTKGRPPREFSAFPSVVSPFDRPAPGLLIRIDSATGQVSQPLLQETHLASRDPRGLQDIFARTERFNADAQTHAAAINKSSPPFGAGVAANPCLMDTALTFRAADTLAIVFSKRVSEADWALFGSGLAAFFFFNMMTDWPLASWAYLGITALMAAATLYSRQRSLDDRFLEYRGLAEALRVLFFLRLGNVDKPVWLGYLTKYSNVVVWLRHALRTIEFCEKAMRPACPPAPGFALIETHWLDDQIAYYRKAEARHRRAHSRGVFISAGAIAFSSLLALALALFALTHWRSAFQWVPSMDLSFAGFDFRTDTITLWLKVSLGLFAAAGLVTRAFLARRADLDISKQYEATRRTFELAKENLILARQPGASWRPETVLETLGNEALIEQGEWLWLRHSRPYEMPKL